MKTHRTYHFLTALLCCLLLLTLGCLPIAATEDLLLQNQAIADETAARFSALITQYEQKEATSKTPANHTIATIGGYATEASALIPSDMTTARTEDLAPAFSLLYEKGALAAKLSWIAYAHDAIDPSNESDAAYVQYLAFCQDVKNAADEATLHGYSDSLCIRMNQTVFKQKIQDLPRALGVDEAHILDQLIAACAEIDGIESADIDGTPYLAIYQRTRDSIVLEQNRLLAKAELSAVYQLLDLPSADKLSALYALSDALTNASSTAEVNRALLSVVRACLDRALPGDGLYTSAYRESLISAMEAAVQAVGENTVVALFPYLDGSHEDFPQKSFRERAPIVFAKDRIEALRTPSDDAALCNLLNAYVQSGGILERCQSKESLDFEVMRATYRVELARKRGTYQIRIEQILPTSSAGALLLQLKAISTELDEAMCARTATDTEAVFQSLLATAVSRMDDLVFEAEAERFRITHADVLNDTTVTEDDRARILAAFGALNALGEQTRDKLGKETTCLNEQYKTLTLASILGYAGDPSCADLRAEVMQKLIEAASALRSDSMSPTALCAEADALQARAEAIHTLLCRYHVIRTHSHYASYDSDSVIALAETAKQAIERLSDPTKTDVGEPTQGSGLIGVETLKKEALCNLERYFAIAELRLAANGASSQRVQELLSSASAAILQCHDLAKIQLLCENGVFHIGASRKADEMRREVNELAEQIRALRGLSDSQKNEILQGEGFAALQSACVAAENAEDSQILGAIAATFAADRQRILQNAETRALAAGVDAAKADVAQMLKELQQALASYSYITDTERNAHRERLEALRASWEASLALPIASWDALDELLAQMTESLMGLRARAESDDCAACRKVIVAAWQTQYAHPSHYSPLHYQTISALLTDGKAKLETLSTVGELLAYRESLTQQLTDVPTLLDESKSEAYDRLKQVYENVLNNKKCYGAEAWKKIEEIYRNSLYRIECFSKIEDCETVMNIATEAIQAIQEIRMDQLYTDNEASHPLPETYPQGYDPSASGYFGMLAAQGAIPFNASFSAMPFSADHITASLRASIRNGDVFDGLGNPITGKRLRLLRNCSVIGGLALSYSHASLHDGTYRITLLLPEDFDTSRILGIAYLREDNSVEFFECSVENKTVSFDITHFSDFYIVSKKTTNLTPIIVILSLILLCEVAAILYLLARRKKWARDDADSQAVIPAAAVVGGVIPKGGIPIVIALGLCVLVAGGVLAWLLLEEKARRRAPKDSTPLLASKNRTEEELPSPVAVGVLAPSAANTLAEPSDLANEESCHSAESASVSTPIFAPLETVTAELANQMMTDEEATNATEQALFTTAEFPFSPVGKRVAINIDVISKNFAANDTVTAEALKQRGLLPKRATAIKILARGTLDKPLTVIANDFSATAAKMILLTGGKVIITR